MRINPEREKRGKREVRPARKKAGEGVKREKGEREKRTSAPKSEGKRKKGTQKYLKRKAPTQQKAERRREPDVPESCILRARTDQQSQRVP